MFNKMHNRIEISGNLHANTALYIGTGQDSFDPLSVQGSLLKDHKGYPYIPGSSLKGVLRSFLESVQTEDCERGEKCPKRLFIKDKAMRVRRLSEWGGSEETFTEAVEAKSCMACRLFGSSVLAGKVKLRDATLADLAAWSGTGLRTGNAIERETHTTVGGALFDTEFIPPGTDFFYKMMAENLTLSEARVLGASLWIFANGGVTVGGRGRAGFGEILLSGMKMKLSFKGAELYEIAHVENLIKDEYSIFNMLELYKVYAPEPQDHYRPIDKEA